MFVTGFAELEAMETALADVATVPLSCLSAEDLGAHLTRLQRLRAQLDAAVCATTAAAEAAGTHTLGPSRTIGSWVGQETNADPAVVARDRTLGVWLRPFGGFADAFARGTITRRHVEALRTLDNPRTRVRLREAQDYLVTAAVDCSWRDFQQVLAAWLIAGDPDGVEPRDQIARRHLTLTERPDGTLKGTFELDSLAASALKTAVRHRAQQLWRADQIFDPDQRRTTRQRQADALVELVANGFRRADGTTPRPLVHLTMSPGVAQAMRDHLAHGQLDTIDVDHRDPDRRCHLADGSPIHPIYGLAAIASGVLRRLVMGADSEILDLGRSVRDFPAHFRDALHSAHLGRCTIAGCDAPPEWLQVDHVIPWARHGPTALANAQLLCDPDNKAKTDMAPPTPP